MELLRVGRSSLSTPSYAKILKVRRCSASLHDLRSSELSYWTRCKQGTERFPSELPGEGWIISRRPPNYSAKSCFCPLPLECCPWLGCGDGLEIPGIVPAVLAPPPGCSLSLVGPGWWRCCQSLLTNYNYKMFGFYVELESRPLYSQLRRTREVEK